MLDFKKQTDLSKVPYPQAAGRVVLFVDASGRIKFKDDTGAVFDGTEKGDDGADSNPIAVGQLSLNAARAGVVAGLLLQSVDVGKTLISKNFCIKGVLKFVSTAAGTASVLVDIGGLLVNFVGVAVTNTTQYFNFEIELMAINAALAAGYVKQNIAPLGASSAVGGAGNQAVTGAIVSNVVNVSVKTPVTTQVTTLLSTVQVS